MKSKLKLIYLSLTALMLWFALGLQFYISIGKDMAEGRSLAGAIVQVLSYFTIQTNLLIAVAFSSILILPGTSWGRFFSRTSVLTAINVYINIVGLVYAFVLKGLWKPEGLFKLADYLLHTASPVLYLLFWLFFVKKQLIPWKRVFPWALFPLVYLFYSLIRGYFTGYYPYPFVDAAKIGYQQVFINSLLVLLVFMVISAVFITINRVLKRDESLA
ncbi:Pr6Pr family membrane protein [Pedobacter sp. AW31-3R]|uniref:Pr6Pr family membrane protein n=1 Tax=Pedobacter sp. AW31-3R TaxID=3445781 RepID=UPI003FA0220F